ncbi:MAG: hypothetical protein E7643_02755 [Ruminococcaceae bacterium]|nr:hypothetical protein [Oscillospiraceae bacterium]
MYSRYYGHRPAGEIKIPENYNGCAFPKEPTERAPSPRYLEVAKPSFQKEREAPPVKEAEEKIPVPPPTVSPSAKETGEEHSESEKAPTDSPSLPTALLSPFSFLRGKGNSRSLASGLDFDQLLILGLILLLLNSEADTDLILCLGLLLLCG